MYSKHTVTEIVEVLDLITLSRFSAEYCFSYKKGRNLLPQCLDLFFKDHVRADAFKESLTEVII